jgi:ankyrin repeat protein
MNMRLGTGLLLLALSILAGCNAGVLTPSHHLTEEYNAAFAASSRGDLAALKADVIADPGLLKATEWEHRTLLHDAVDKGQFETAAYLIDKGASLDAATDDGRTVVHMAAQHGDMPLLKLLISRNAKINPVDRQGWTPLDRAVKWNHPDAASFLRAHGGQENEH